MSQEGIGFGADNDDDSAPDVSNNLYNEEEGEGDEEEEK